MDATSWDKAKDLIADALELPASKRDAFLESRCGDPRLLAEVRAMIKDYTDAPGFLEHPPTFKADDLDEQDDNLDPGSQVGPYVVLDRLGRGGMGQVFLGNDRRLKRKVALKRLLPSRLGPGDERARILREARAAARINHPNVATIHDVIEHDTRVFIVMEYVEGESLAARLRRERLPLAHVVAIGRQLASALAAAHAKGVVHRDLKPGNIQLTPEGAVKVLDFGVAKAIGGMTSTSEVPTTASGVVFDVRGVQPGTPEYMSPEQMVGRDVDERSDIFSLGIVLFEMTVGRRPFADDPMDRVAAIGRPAERVDAIDPRAPKELADIIARALEVDVRKRFQYAAEVGSALDAVQSEIKTATALAGPAAVVPAARRGVALRAAAAIVATPLVLGLLGLISTAAFNVTMQRPAPFASEPLFDYIEWGIKSNIAQLIFALLAAMLAGALAFVRRLVATIDPLSRVLARARRTRHWIASTLSLNDPAVLAQGFALVGTLAVAAVIWRYRRLIAAFMRTINRATPDQVLLLAPENLAERAPYGIAVNVLLVVLSVGLFRIVQLRTRQRTRDSAGPIAIAVAMLAVVVLMQQIPYRILWQNKSERVEYAGARCYVIGEHEAEWLIYCPDTAPPRNRVVRRDDPAVRQSGIIESIFTRPDGPGTARPARGR